MYFVGLSLLNWHILNVQLHYHPKDGRQPSIFNRIRTILSWWSEFEIDFGLHTSAGVHYLYIPTRYKYIAIALFLYSLNYVTRGKSYYTSISRERQLKQAVDSIHRRSLYFQFCKNAFTGKFVLSILQNWIHRGTRTFNFAKIISRENPYLQFCKISFTGKFVLSLFVLAFTGALIHGSWPFSFLALIVRIA